MAVSAPMSSRNRSPSARGVAVDVVVQGLAMDRGDDREARAGRRPRSAMRPTSAAICASDHPGSRPCGLPASCISTECPPPSRSRRPLRRTCRSRWSTTARTNSSTLPPRTSDGALPAGPRSIRSCRRGTAAGMRRRRPAVRRPGRSPGQSERPGVRQPRRARLSPRSSAGRPSTRCRRSSSSLPKIVDVPASTSMTAARSG